MFEAPSVVIEILVFLFIMYVYLPNKFKND